MISGDLLLLAPAGGRVALTSSDILGTIIGATPDQVVFTVSALSGGQLEFATNPGVPVTTFTQADIDGGFVRFVDTSGDGTGSFDLTIEETPGVFTTETVTVTEVTTQSVFSIADLDGSNGFRIEGELNFQRTGADLGLGADINNDGFADIFIATGGSGNDGYVVFGGGDPFASTLDLATIDGTDGFQISGLTAGSNLGHGITGAGDINGDGIDDFIIGAALYSGDDRGAAYVIFGSEVGFPADLDVTSLDGTNGFRIRGFQIGDYLGDTVSTGDLNGDGLADIVLRATRGDGANGSSGDAGEVSVIFGSSAGFAADFSLATLDGSNGFTFFGSEAGEFIGFSIATGDINGDGFDDLFSATPLGDDGDGRVDIVFGGASGPAGISQTDLNGTNGFSVYSETGSFGDLSTVTSVDLNGDGIDDLVLGDPDTSGVNYGINGSVYVIFGTTSGFNTSFPLTSLDGSNGFIIRGRDSYSVSRFGEDLSSAGDFNGDGIEDLAIGAEYGTGINPDGGVYILFGSRAGFDAEISAEDLDGSNGILITGVDNGFFYQIGSIGDTNGDGFDDIAIGGNRADPQGRDSAGETAVFFGLQTAAPPNVTGDLTIEVTANAGKVLTPEDLSASDAVSSASEIVFHVSTTTNGFIAKSGNPGAPVDNFTQAELELGDILFVNDGTLSDGLFTVSATDAQGEVSADTTVTVMLVSAATIVGDLSIVAPDAGKVALTNFDLLGAEDGIAADQVTFTASSIVGGQLETAGVPGVAITTFTAEDVSQKLIRFVDDGGVSGGGFDLTLTDADGVSVTKSVVVRPDGFRAPGLNALDGGNGFEISGDFQRQYVGYAISSAGDVNGDGFDDFLIGTSHDYADDGISDGPGTAFLIFGGAGGFPAELNVTEIDGTNGFQIRGVDNFDRFGLGVAGVGDVNGDGIDDFAIGASLSAPSGRDNAGEVYVFFGTQSGFGTVLDASTLDGTNGFSVIGAAAQNRTGAFLGDGGDFNGDGLSDLLISGPNLNGSGIRLGVSHVIFGTDQGFSAEIDLASLSASSGATFEGLENLDNAGFIENAGDFNGDGIDDLIIGAQYADGVGNATEGSGEAYLVFGSATLGGAFDLASLDGTNGIRFLGTDSLDHAGERVAGAGDINGDGFADILITAEGADPVVNAVTINRGGSVYAVFGTDANLGATFALSSVDGTNGFRVDGVDDFDRLNRVDGLGDLNGDGIDDFLIGANRAEQETGDAFVGEAYVIFGQDGGFAQSIALENLTPDQGVTINGFSSDYGFAYEVSDAGDINGDGLGDFLLSSPYQSANGVYFYGTSFVVFGSGAKPSEIGGDLAIEVAINDQTVLTLADINVTDPLGVDADIFYDVKDATNGNLAFLADPATLIERFSQADVAAGAVVFVHRSFSPGGSFTIEATDALGDISAPVVINATIAAIGSIDGDLSISVLDGGRVALTAADVLGAEAGQTPGDISLTVTNVAGGQLEFATDPGVAITSFTQQDVNDKNVRFVDAAGATGGSFDVTLIDAVGASTTETVTVVEAAPFTFADRSLGLTGGVPSLDGTDGFLVLGANASSGMTTGAYGSRIGGTTETAGDINGDGFADIIIATDRDARNGVNVVQTGPSTYNYYNEGVGYVVFGGAAGGPALIELENLNPADGFRLPGSNTYERLGYDVAGIGDINGDGLDDVAITTRQGYTPDRDAGEVFIVFGDAAGFAAEIEVRDLDGSDGFRLIGAIRNDNVSTISSAGDFNNDGVEDFVVSSRRSSPEGRENAGEFFIVFGRGDGFAPTFDLAGFDARDGLRVLGASANDYGRATAAAGDVNGDGIDDVIVSAVGADPNGVDQAGSNYVLFGSDDAGGVLDLQDIDGLNGARFDGVTGFGRSGLSVAGGSDFNGDGFNDLVFGEQFYDGPTGSPYIDANDTGAVFVVFGGSTFDAVTSLDALDGTDGFRIEGRPGDQIGYEFELIDDFNGDGLADLVVAQEKSSPNAINRAGEVFILFGSETSPGAVVTLGDANFDGISGTRFYGTADRAELGQDVASAGDVNGDGITDLLIGAQGLDNVLDDNRGGVFVIFGENGPAPFVGGDLEVEFTLGGVTLITLEDLAGSEPGSADPDLVYHVTEETNGFVAFAFDPSTGRNSFTQAEVAAGDVVFVNDGTNLTGSFSVELTDAEGDISAAVEINAIVVSKATIDGDLSLTALGGVGAALTSADILGAEAGVSPNQVVFSASAVTGGQLEFAGASGVAITTFTQADVNARLVRFADDPVARGGSFDLSVTDADGVVRTETVSVDEAQAFFSSFGGLNGGFGTRILGPTYSYTGYDIASVGDVNGDGLSDIAVAAVTNVPGGQDLPMIHVVYGTTAGFPAEFDASLVDGSNGFSVTFPKVGGVRESLGDIIDGLGDVNGDGVDDFAFRAEDGGGQGIAEVYVIFGDDLGFPSTFDVSALDGTNGFTFVNPPDSDSSQVISAAGDLNGDGINDILIEGSATDYAGNSSGSVFAVFGSDTGFANTIDLTALNPGQAVRFDGANAIDRFGYHTADIGDFNGDGFDDIAVSDRISNSPFYSRGTVYVIFGNSAGFDDVVSSSSFDLTNSVAIRDLTTAPINGNLSFGYDLASAGDVNGDGIDDIIIGMSTGGPGYSYIVFGSATGFTADINVRDLDGSDGFIVQGEGAYDRLGTRVGGAGDVNGDGFDDVLVGTRYSYHPITNERFVGSDYVIFGQAAPFDPFIEIDTLTPDQGFGFYGDDAFDLAGYSLSDAGDINGDGLADFIVGAHYTYVENSGIYGQGAAYVIFGAEAVTTPARVEGDLTVAAPVSGSTVLTPGDLNAIEANSGGAELLYAIEGAVNGFAAFVGDPDTPISTFTQSQIDTGQIVFTNNGVAAEGSLTFTVTDAEGDISAPLQLQALLASSAVIDGDLTLTLLDGEIVAITAADVLGSELGRTAEQIVFTASNITGGQLELATDPGVAVTNFTQAQIDARDVRFSDVFDNPNASFDLTVTDQLGIDRTVSVNVQLAAEFPEALTVDQLNGVNGFTLYNDALERAVVGISVSSAGDLNADGFNDLLIGAPGGTVGGDTDEGHIYVVYGNDTGFPTQLDLSSLDGTDGFQVNGIQDPGTYSQSYFGYNVSDLGDINGDGIGDIIVREFEGEAFVLFGSGTGFDALLNIGDLDGTDGFQITGLGRGGRFTNTVSSAGDFNGDGLQDILIGDYRVGPNGDGVAYVIYGSDTGFAATMDISALDGTNGTLLTGPTNGVEFGLSVSNAGDFNNDGRDDIAITGNSFSGADIADADAVYVIFGQDGGLGANFDVATLNGANGLAIGPAGDNSGNIYWSVGDAGDVNGDGINDIIIGDNEYNNSGNGGLGSAYIVFGASQPFDPRLDLSTLDGTNGFQVVGDVSHIFGFSVTGIGDINGDGVDDIAASDPFSTRNAVGIAEYGEVFVVFGSSLGFDAKINVSELDGSQGFRVEGIDATSRIGRSITELGDLDGDGLDDFAIGSPFAVDANGGNGGETYVVFGQATVDAPILSGDFTAEATFSQTIGLTTNDLSADENGSDDADLLYHLTNVSGGFVANSDDPTTRLDRFTQDELTAGQIIFVKDASFADGGFDFTVTDPEGDIAGPQSFAVPLVSAATIDGDATLTVANGAEVALKTADILGAEEGLLGSQVTFTASNISGGQLELATDPGNAITSFTQAQVSARDIRFIDAGAAAGGSFDLSLTDADGVSVIKTVVVREPFAPANPLDISLLDGTDGFQVLGSIPDSDVGRSRSLSFAGDVNGDGLADFILGDRNVGDDDGADPGEAYVVFGDEAGFPAELDLATLNGANGFRLNGAASGDELGYAVAGIGDFNGDGFDDVAVTAGYADTDVQKPGVIYVVYGKAGGFESDLDVTRLAPTEGFTIVGADEGDYAGVALAGFGDVNGDGLADLAIGAVLGDGATNLFNSGEVYVLYGAADPFVDDVNLGALTAAQGVRFDGIAAGQTVGYAVSIEGDLNGDGFDDIVIGASKTTQPNPAGGNFYEAGAAYVVFGSDALPAVTDLSALDGSNGFTAPGLDESNETGYDAALVEDINGDGFDDLVIGSFFTSTPSAYYAGAAYVVFGSDAGFPASLDLASLDGTNGFTIVGSTLREYVGFSVSGAGDFNGDGLNDLLISTYNANNGTYSDAGSVHILYGSVSGFAAEITLTTLNPSDGLQLTNSFGSNANLGGDVARAGDVNGDGAADVLVGIKDIDTEATGFTGGAFVVFGGEVATPATLSGDFTVEVSINGSVGVQAADLFATDEGSFGDFVFHVTNNQNGFVAFDGNLTTPVSRFSQSDLDEGIVTFANDGTDADGSFDVTVTDAQGDVSAPQTVLAVLQGAGDPPVAQDDDFATTANAIFSGDLFAGNGMGPDTDPDGDPFSVVSVNGVALDASTGVSWDFAATPSPDQIDNAFDLVTGSGGQSPTIGPEGIIFDTTAANEEVSLFVQLSDKVDFTGAHEIAFTMRYEAGSTTLPDRSGAIVGFTTEPGVGQLLLINEDLISFAGPSGSTAGSSTTAIDTNVFHDYRITIADTAFGSTVSLFVDGGLILQDFLTGDVTDVGNEERVFFGDATAGSNARTTWSAFSHDAGIPFFDTQAGSDLRVNADGTFTFDPDGAFDGLTEGALDTDAFSYTIADVSGLTDDAVVDFAITGVNDPPVAADDQFFTDQNTAINFADLFADNGFGPDNDPDSSFSIIAVEDDGQAVNSTLTLASGATVFAESDGSLSFDPNGAFDTLAQGATANEVFTYTIADDLGLQSTATVTITITGQNDAPVAADDSFSTDEDTAITGDLFADNGMGADEDVDSDTFTIVEINGTAALVGVDINLITGGKLNVASDGSLSYDPNSAFDFLPEGAISSDSFTYTIEDALGLRSTATVALETIGVDDEPLALAQVFNILENQLLTDQLLAIHLDNELLDPLTFTLANLGDPANGDVVIDLDGGFTYTPDLNFNGQDSFTFEVSDAFTSSQATISIVLAPVSDVTIEGDLTIGLPAGGQVALTTNDFRAFEDGVSPDLQVLTASNVVGGQLEIATDPGASVTTFSQADIDNRLIRFVDDGTGEGSFDLSTIDQLGDTASASLTVQAAAAGVPPILSGDLALDVEVGDAVTILAGDLFAADPQSTDSSELLYHATNAARGFLALASSIAEPIDSFSQADLDAGLIVFVHDGGSDISASVDLTVTDILGDVAGPVTLAVEVDQPPVVFDDAFTINDLDTLSADLFADNGAGSDFDPNGFPLTLATLNGISVAVGDTLTLASGATITVNLNGSVFYDPGLTFAALEIGDTFIETVTYGVIDQGDETGAGQVQITIQGQNSAPVAVDDAATLPEDGAVTFNLITGTGLGADSDFEDGIPTVAAIDNQAALPGVATTFSTISGLQVVLQPDGTVAVSDANEVFAFLDTGEQATSTFTYTVQDSGGLQDTATVNVTIEGANDAPVAVDDAIRLVADETLLVDVIAGQTGVGVDFDAESQALRIVAINGVQVSLGDTVALASGAEVQLTAGSAILYSPNGAFDGVPPLGSAQDSLTYTIVDTGGLTSTATVAVTIDGIVPPPDAKDDIATTDEDSALTFNLFADNGAGEDIDFSADGLSIQAIDGQAVAIGGAITLASGSVLTIGASGDVTVDPSGAFEALDEGDIVAETVTYTIADGLGQTDTATATLRVTGVNDTPEARQDTFATDEVTPLSGNLFADNGSGADADADDPLVITAIGDRTLNGTATITLSSGALLTVGSDGLFSYDPNDVFEDLNAGDVFGDSFVYTLTDDNGAASSATATISVNGITDVIFGTDGDDFLIGTVEADNIDGLGGNDLISGLDGDDTLTGSDDNDVVRGGGDDDLITGNDGDDTLFGEAGADTLDGGDGNDRISGARGNDVLFGRSGEDTLAGGGGNDRLMGASGADTLRGGGGDDTLVGAGGNDRLRGGNGDDMLRGGAGSDQLTGSAGDDTLIGAGGNDRISGGRGNDLLTGGNGQDLFLFNVGDGDDVITRFAQNADKIRILSGAADFAEINLTQVGTDVLVTFSNVSVTVLDEEVSAFSASDFIF